MTTQAKKERMAEEREREKCVVHDFCEANKIPFEFITDYQIRLAERLDIYPTAKKYCFFDRGASRWGMYTTIETVCRQYGII